LHKVHVYVVLVYLPL